MTIHATADDESAHRIIVRNRTADTAAAARNSLQSELNYYASHFTGEDRKALVSAIQSLEKLIRVIG